MNETHPQSPSLERAEQTLRAFFRKEMPEPWPPANVPPDEKSQRLRFSWYVRLVVAASLAFLLIGYLTLASMFPPAPEPGLSIDRSQTIGLKPHLHGSRTGNPTTKAFESINKEATNR